MQRAQSKYPSGVALVDVSLLRQTQLRSLSKSDTKLHEIQRPRPGYPQLRPISMDPVYPPSKWQVPCPRADNDDTYSNLAFAPQPLTFSGYETVGFTVEPNRPASGAAEYACIRKGNKSGGSGVQKQNRDQWPMVPSPSPETDALKLEEMYSKVNKKKKPMDVSTRQGATEKAPAFGMTAGNSPKRVLSAQSEEEDLYESISEMDSCAPESDGNGEGELSQNFSFPHTNTGRNC
ncbi:lck-interacting transmembrane adapter 1 isoform X2 [Xenopus laevis]|nr:lck-interacting transmembrane adapter 1 isoform X2 [Xenopus laevis]XP_041434282.1 lck-interacting transmembrane adapter 1 isoform X2 [Xenopus laevis]XP_041434283.1 lck-interacting transmembrane adapter 1 isoform X2 [Xenopus laevis]